MTGRTEEPEFLLPRYITITRDPRTQLVVTIGGDQRAAGILQTTGGFLRYPGPSIHYHRQPVAMPVEKQRIGATAAAHALLVAGYGVYLAPDLNVLATPDGDREAAFRCLAQLTERARRAGEPHLLADVMAEVAAPETGMLPHLREVLVSVWTSWANHLREQGHDDEPAELLSDITCVLSRKTREIEDLRAQATRAPKPATARQPPAAARAAKTPSPRRR
ncbi:hypothetical protein BJP40_03775 [Streptomyces sp. CC53]|uniref:hypothetical protein n=1 Tax=Streptomyces sp. CC53 TaxID=1906740 RepID=UPI0008DE09AA|nr:hypothetical protein [Streptomyces sp. CC53]OII62133.1 hypothetical protein BJP40_03775 [Streptomyces sp. CC53]